MGNLIHGLLMVKGHTLGLMETNMLVDTRMGIRVVKVHTLIIMETSMKVDGTMGKNTVKEHSLMEKGNGKETSM